MGSDDEFHYTTISGTKKDFTFSPLKSVATMAALIAAASMSSIIIADPLQASRTCYYEQGKHCKKQVLFCYVLHVLSKQA